MRDDESAGLQHTAITRDALSEFRSKQPDCVLALWADIEARIVLVVDSDLRYPQESLDALCNIASHVLRTPSIEIDPAPDSAIFADPTGNRIFLRDVARPTCALICTSAPGLDPDDLLLAMTTFLSIPLALDETA